MTAPLLELLSGADAHPALVCPDDATATSYERLREEVEALALQLRGAGIERGSRVAIVLPNGPEIVELLLAAASLGAMAAPLNPAYTTAEFRFYLDDIRPGLIVAGAGQGEALRAAAGQIPVVDLEEPGTGALPTLGRAGTRLMPAASHEPGQADDVALLLHTSGTTSRPKQVPLRQRNLVAQSQAIAAFYGLGEDDVSYCAMPLFHVHGVVASTLAQLAAGGTVITPRRFTPRRFWGQAEQYGMTWFSAGPTIHRMILDQQGGPSPRLRLARSCSSALSPELLAEAERRYGVPVLEAYGMTEATHQMTSNPLPPAERRPGSVGVSAGAEFRIVQKDGRDVPAGEIGEVIVRGPGVIEGYLENPEANATSFIDGWFRTGDRGFEKDGYLTLAGRIKELIIRGGENISPLEIEAALLAHPAVSEAVAFGVDDAKYGQTVAAAVVVSADVDEAALRAHSRESLAAFKVPEQIHVLDAIPKSATGKVQRSRLAEQLGDGS